MIQYQMGAIESRFANMIWEREPISTVELVKECEKCFGWKKTTTYTVLKRLNEKGIFQNNKGIVTSLMSKEEFYSVQSNQYVDTNFEGSLPAFLTAFTSKKKLGKYEIDYLKDLIDNYKGE